MPHCTHDAWLRSSCPAKAADIALSICRGPGADAYCETSPRDQILDRPWKKPEYGASHNAKWPEEVIEHVKRLYVIMLQTFDVVLSERDGYPWFGEASTMPKGWGMELVAGLTAERWDRVRLKCNRGEDILDTPDVIFVKCIFVACVIACKIDKQEEGKHWTPEEKLYFKKRYVEFLDIPLDANMFDAICFAVAHAEQGMPVRNG